jgi:phage/plasmid primase-like uncharacterized protein
MADLNSLFSGGFRAMDHITMGALDLVRPEEAFRDAAQAAGLVIDRVLADGEIHRVPTTSSKRNERAGWYTLHVDGTVPVGIFGSWKEPSFESKWVADIGRELSLREKAEQEKWLRELRERRDVAKRKAQEEAAAYADELIGALSEASDEHPYLVAKGVKAHGIKVDGAGRLVIPITGLDGQIQTYQTIRPDTFEKRYLKDGKKEGGFFEIRGNRKIVFVVEGYATGATVHEATGATVILAFDCGSLMGTAKIAREMYPAARIIIGADNDHATDGNPGITKARLAARSINGEVVYPEFAPSDIPADAPKRVTDFNDLARVRGMDEVVHQLSIVTSTSNAAFKFVRVDELELKDIAWLVENYVEADSLSQLFGDPGCGKSFVAIDMACCVATGTPWHGNEVTQGPVFYIAGEGHNGLARRFKAWELGNGASLDGAPLYKSQRAATLYDASEAAIVSEAINDLIHETGEKPHLIIIDTLARNMGGDENSTEDMNAFISHLDLYFRQKYGACVMIVHHSGAADKDRSRGSTALRGALDSEYKVDLMATGDKASIQLASKKMKDAELPKPLTFGLTQIDLPIYDRHAQPIKGAYLTNQTADINQFIEQAAEKAGFLGKNQQKALNLLTSLIFKRKKDDDRDYVLLGEWKESCMKSMDRNQFWKARKALEEKSIVVINGVDEALQTVALQRKETESNEKQRHED